MTLVPEPTSGRQQRTAKMSRRPAPDFGADRFSARVDADRARIVEARRLRHVSPAQGLRTAASEKLERRAYVAYPDAVWGCVPVKSRPPNSDRRRLNWWAFIASSGADVLEPRRCLRMCIRNELAMAVLERNQRVAPGAPDIQSLSARVLRNCVQRWLLSRRNAGLVVTGDRPTELQRRRPEPRRGGVRP